jgi:hypothetical protein
MNTKYGAHYDGTWFLIGLYPQDANSILVESAT